MDTFSVAHSVFLSQISAFNNVKSPANKFELIADADLCDLIIQAHFVDGLMINGLYASTGRKFYPIARKTSSFRAEI